MRFSMGTKPKPVIHVVEALAVTLVSLGLYLPFLAMQYDPNGLIEAMAVENGRLLNKNHMLFRRLDCWRGVHYILQDDKCDSDGIQCGEGPGIVIKN